MGHAEEENRPDRPAISVIVCTRNRSSILADACRAILAVEAPEPPWELLIVDNGSTDDSLEIARRLVAENPRVRLVEEPELGLSAARNTGIAQAHGELLVFVDDDAFPDPGWLREIVNAFADPTVDCAGGPIDPLIEGELPEWFNDRYLPYLSAWDLGDQTVPLAYNEYPRGTNVAYRRSAIERVGDFRLDLGRRGSSLRSCEETELCLRIERTGGKILYLPGARVGHRVAAGRLSRDWLVDRFGAQGTSEAIIDWAHAGLPGLRRGYRKFRTNAEKAEQIPPGSAAEQADGELFRRCQRHAFRCYLRSALLCPLRVRRWRPGSGSGPVEDWLPFC